MATITVSNKFKGLGSWSICHQTRSKRVLFQIFVVLFAEPRFQHLSKNNLEDCEQIINLARDNVVWESVELTSPLTNTPRESSSQRIFKAKMKSNLKNSPTPSKSPVGFINKGNACYANTILQTLALSVIPLLWRTSSTESAQLPPLLKSIVLSMAITEKSAVTIDPSNFLWALKHKIPSTPCRMLQKFYK